MSPQALQRRVEVLEKSGLGKGWQENHVGHGPAYCFTTPDGHNMELYYETEWYQAPAELKPALKNQASRYSDRGVGLRRLDHINLLAADVSATRRFLEECLGGRLTEQVIYDDGSEKGAWLTFTNKSYDVAIAEDAYGAKGRLHHFTYAVDNREAILRAADICLEHGVFIETGPHKHAIQQTFFLYVYEPGGNRFEIANAGARLILAPDWKPIVWSEAERKKGQAWGLKTIESFHKHGTPPVE
jgi:catechol 2,3-dioxygenase